VTRPRTRRTRGHSKVSSGPSRTRLSPRVPATRHVCGVGPRSIRLGLIACTLVAACLAQSAAFEQGGFLENRALFYPRAGVTDQTQRIDELLLRWEARLRLSEGWRIFVGIDAQTDTHNQVERTWHLSWDDRGIARPDWALRTAFLQYTHGVFRLEAGKQVLHWGVMDLFPPTDRFAPRDYLSPSGSDYLGIWAARAVIDSGTHSLELIYGPRFTPSRAPLIGQRWVLLPPFSPLFTYRVDAPEYPGGPQLGLRYHEVRSPFEYSLYFYQGFQTLPSLPSQVNFLRRTVDYLPVYPQVRMLGADFTMPWRGLLWKAESSYETSASAYSHNIWTYEAQVEKSWDKLQLEGGYSGEFVTDDRDFAALAIDRSLRKSFTGKVVWTPTAKQSLSGEWYLRQTGAAFITRIVYSRRLADSLRASVGWNWITARKNDPIEPYSVNSFLSLQLRYSF